MKILRDTSVLVPALIPALPQHEKAAPHLKSALRGEMSLIISSHALAECYSSLTALPMSPSITPGQARRLIQELIQENVAEAAGEIAEFGGEDYMNVLQRMADLGLESGAVYDALHVQCAEEASADEVRTFNGKDFRRMPPGGGTDLVVL
jgi:predicted nucleic acid-binding protein